MRQVFKKSESLKDVPTHYCTGCGHGIIHRIIAEVVDELSVREKTIAVAPVGCAVLAYDYFNFDVCEAPHGRTPVVATGIKRVHPENLVISYQGDGDLAAIGTAEIIHTANRGEKITVIFVNNGVYGMTGGQMAPTTLPGQKTLTTPQGRSVTLDGYPIKISELLSMLDGVSYIERVSCTTPGNVLKAKKAIKKAFDIQLKGTGFSMVEILSPCPVHMDLTPLQSLKWIDENMTKVYPLGILKDTLIKDA